MDLEEWRAGLQPQPQENPYMFVKWPMVAMDRDTIMSMYCGCPGMVTPAKACTPDQIRAGRFCPHGPEPYRYSANGEDVMFEGRPNDEPWHKGDGFKLYEEGEGPSSNSPSTFWTKEPGQRGSMFESPSRKVHSWEVHVNFTTVYEIKEVWKTRTHTAVCFSPQWWTPRCVWTSVWKRSSETLGAMGQRKAYHFPKPVPRAPLLPELHWWPLGQDPYEAPFAAEAEADAASSSGGVGSAAAPVGDEKKGVDTAVPRGIERWLVKKGVKRRAEPDVVMASKEVDED